MVCVIFGVRRRGVEKGWGVGWGRKEDRGERGMGGDWGGMGEMVGRMRGGEGEGIVIVEENEDLGR